MPHLFAPWRLSARTNGLALTCWISAWSAERCRRHCEVPRTPLLTHSRSRAPWILSGWGNSWGRTRIRSKCPYKNQGLIYENPETGRWESADRYLTGRGSGQTGISATRGRRRPQIPQKRRSSGEGATEGHSGRRNRRAFGGTVGAGTGTQSVDSGPIPARHLYPQRSQK